MKSVRFVNFWRDFDPHNNIFLEVLNENFGSMIIRNNERSSVDFEFTSVFLKRSAVISKKVSSLVHQTLQSNPALASVYESNQKISRGEVGRRIWYTGENVRPPITAGFDGFLSFDQDNYGGKNAYIPLWWLRLNWFSDFKLSQQVGTPVDMNLLVRNREARQKKTKFACAFVGNPHPMRLHFIEMLKKIGNVDVYGRYVGKPVKNKYEISKDYKYSVCFENDHFPGYVTEKLIDAYVTETIPIYWGNLGNDNVINSSSFVNLSDFDSVEDCIDSISQIDYDAVYQNNFLNSLPSLQDVKRIIFGV
jgi:hypothetical protein